MLKIVLTNFYYIFLACLLWACLAGLDGIKHFPFFSCASLTATSILIMYFEPTSVFNPARLFIYSFWLLEEIINSSIEVTKIIWDFNEEINPKIVKIDSSFGRSKGRLALYANSITLTPGTLSLDADGSSILVHALNQNFVNDLKSGWMEEKVSEI
ncbi:MAG: Na+/H+ antiporter subunit E [Rickettsiaceae bacterium]|nr:Na+/H+ antiporter subunit E [Rickettsiaceae bacterium]